MSDEPSPDGGAAHGGPVRRRTLGYRDDMAGHDRLRERTRAQTVQTVQDVALRLMGAQGFDGVTVTAIADEAGVSPSTVYRHFGTKESLVLTGHGLERLVPAVEAAVAETSGHTTAALLRRAVADLLSDLDPAQLLPRLQLVFGHEGLTTAFEHQLLGYRHRLADVLAEHRGKSGGRTRDDALAGAVLGMLLATLDRWQRNDGATTLVKSWKRACGATLSE